MEGTPKAIEIKGIVRNATVIGAQDGQAEDLINLRFMDGSWRASGDGRLIDFTMGAEYTQLYVHTNVYHHLLGVHNGTLYWFAEIGNDGVTFYPLDGSSRTSWPANMQDLPTAPVALTTVVGDLTITQTGHLLTIIDESDDFEHFVFKTGEDKYISVFVDANGKQTDRALFPFGQIHLNLYCPGDDAHSAIPDFEGATFSTAYQVTDILVNTAKKKNLLTQHFLAIVAFELYDGSYAYACNPVHLCPREGVNYICETKKRMDTWVYTTNERYLNLLVDISNPTPGPPPGLSTSDPDSCQYVEITLRKDDGVITEAVSNNVQLIPTDIRYFSDSTDFDRSSTSDLNRSHITKVFGSDLVLSIDNSIIDSFDESIFNSICIFITTESNILPTVSSREDFNNRREQFDFKGEEKSTYYRLLIDEYENGTFVRTSDSGGHSLDSPFIFSRGEFYRKKKDIIYDLLHSPFYLLKRYKKEELYELLDNPIVKLEGKELDGILMTENLVQQKQLPIEATSRTTYLPKVSYMYNGRLHIANYKSYPFFGYPIDQFHLHNHSVKVQDGAWFPAEEAGKRVLPNLADNNDAYLQYPKERVYITNEPDLISAGAPYLLIKTYLSTSQGEQIVCRYIQAYDPSLAPEHTANFIEALNPLLTYPDARAKKMEIYYIEYYNGSNEDTQFGDDIVREPGLHIRKKEFLLKPHPYLNMAYYIDPDLKPIQFSNFEPLVEPTIQ